MLAETYYGLRLANQVVQVREESWQAFKRHYEDAVKLEENGLITKSIRLFAQVIMDESYRQLEAARKEEEVIQNRLKKMLKIDSGIVVPRSPLFMNETLPLKHYYEESVQSENYLLNQLTLQEKMADSRIRIDQSAYLPNIALFGKQTLWAHGIQSNLLPRTMVGVGFAWNLFDGLEREKRVRQAKVDRQILGLGKEKARDELTVGVDKLYSELQKAQDNVRSLNTSIELTEELVRTRKKAFAEGMATSTEVIDAQNLLSHVKLARLAAYYEYDVLLMNLLTLCGIPETFTRYSETAVQL